MGNKSSAENYLETILILSRQSLSVRSVDIANELEFSKPSVSVAMKNLRAAGHIRIDGEGFIALTESGLKIAETMYERHVTISDWLISLGVDKKTAVSDACRMEHDISEQSFTVIKKYILSAGGGPSVKYFRKMTGERLYLSPVSAAGEDIEKYLKWSNDKANDGFFHYDDFFASKSGMKFFYEPPADMQRYNIVLLDGDVLIGCVALQNIDHLNRVSFLGVVVGEEEHRSKGYGTEAVRLILHYGFNTLNLNNIMLSVGEDNRAAVACYKKVGFKEAGRRREWQFKDGKYIDRIYMDMLAREYNA